jgi:hypothetical protein
MVRISLRLDTATTSQQKTCHCLGLSEIAQTMEADKKPLISNTVWSAIVGEPDAISTRTRQVPLSGHGDDISPSSESGEKRGERAERRLRDLSMNC